jgi:hypothetical protein
MQTSFAAPAAAFAGLVADSFPKSIISRANASRKLVEVVASTTDGTYTITINGTAAATYAASSASAATIIADLIADMAANADVTAVAGNTTAKMWIEQISYSDTGFTIALASITGFTATTRVEAAAALPFGVGVCAAGTGSNKCRLPRVIADVNTGLFLGITCAETAREPSSSSTPGGYKSGASRDVVSIAEMGHVWVAVEGTVTEGQQLFCRYAAGTGTQLGAFRADADSATAGAVVGLQTTQARTGAGLVLARYIPNT